MDSELETAQHLAQAYKQQRDSAYSDLRIQNNKMLVLEDRVKTLVLRGQILERAVKRLGEEAKGS